jgi:putative flippase GtrA
MVCIIPKVTPVFWRFCAVGALGFAVDAALTLGVQTFFNAAPWQARLPAFLLASLVTFMLNQAWTFKVKLKNKLKAYGHYMLSALAGTLLNYAIFLLTIAVLTSTHTHALLGIMLGSLAGLGANYALARWVVFAKV